VTRATPGQVLIRVVNPERMLSNAAPLSLTTAPVVVAVSPSTVVQAPGTTTLTVDGRGFASDVRIQITPPGGGTPVPLPTTVESATRATAQLASTIAVGAWDLAAALPGGAASPPVKLVIAEGLPVLTAVNPSCVVAGASAIAVQGTATGSRLYPTSALHVSYGGDTTLPTSCAPGSPLVDAATGECTAGLAASVDVPPGTAGSTLEVWVVNPGSPPGVSERRTITVKASGQTCP